MRLPSDILKTSQGRDFAMRLLILQSDSTEPAVLEEKLQVLKILESGEWKEYLHKPKKELECVYFLLDTVQKVVKIGYTTNIDARFNSLQSGNVNALKILASVPGGQKLERQFHKRLSHLRVRGEWFKDGTELRNLIKEVKGVEYESPNY